MTAHIELPALDSGEFSPASLSQKIVTGLLRGELKFDGLVYTDSLQMDAVARALTPGDAAVRAIKAGNDFVLESADDAAAVAAIKAAIASGVIPAAQIDASVRRILRAKARLGLHKARAVPLDDLPARVGGRAHAAVAQQVSQRSITLVKDDRNQVPLRVPRDASVLYLSMLDYPSGWRIAAPSRTFIPELRKHWPSVTSIELSDRSTSSELDLVRATAVRYDAIVVSVFVRTASGSGRQDLAPPLVRLLGDLARLTASTPKPLVTTFFGNPYVVTAVPTLPAVLLTYDFYDLAEASAVRALAGEAPITGRLPIALPGLFDAGWGIVR
jgi:beta-N-acetylhexosaminidase